MLKELTDWFIINNYVLCVHHMPETALRAEDVHDPRHFPLPQNASKLRDILKETQLLHTVTTEQQGEGHLSWEKIRGVPNPTTGVGMLRKSSWRK